jgi:hypothetical protein
MVLEHKIPVESATARAETADEAPASPVDRQIFSKRWILSPLLYQISMDEEDLRTVLEWKKDIDAEIGEVTHHLQNGTLKTSQRRTLGDAPTERDIVLFCIARFIVRRQKNQKSFQWKFAKKCVPGGRHHIRELGGNFDTCMDTAAAAKVLAEQYGVQGEIVRPGKQIHYYWQAADGNREIIDTLQMRRNTGYARSAEMYGKNRDAAATVSEDDRIGET